MPKIIRGVSISDQRGTVAFINDFNMQPIKRFYSINHLDINIVRAWRLHRIEQRWFHVVKGEFLIRLVNIDDWVSPSKNLPIIEFLLTEKNNEVLHIPAGFGSSIQATEESSIMIVFADYGIENAQFDNYLFPSDYFESD